MALQKILRLDNASLIYPASQSKKYASLFRMSVTLSGPVETPLLQQALEAVVDRIPARRVSEVAKARGCTVTELLAAAMVAALQAVHAADRHRKRSVLKVNVPVDLRRIFGGSTLRNFSSYVMLGVDVRNGYLDFDRILEVVRAQKQLYTISRSGRSRMLSWSSWRVSGSRLRRRRGTCSQG